MIKAIFKFVSNFQETCETFFLIKFFVIAQNERTKARTKCLSKLIALGMEIIDETFSQSSYLKPPYKMSSCRLLLLVLSFKFKAKSENSKAGVFLNSKSGQKTSWKTCY